MGTRIRRGAFDGRALIPVRADHLLHPLVTSGRNFYLFTGVLLTIIGVAGFAYYVQLTEGLVVTGMRSQIMWALYISNFVFFIGISHAGTLISAILRVSNAEWRRPITRMAESITVMAISVGALMPIVDLGRPDRLLNLILYGRLQSPIIWDLISIGTYLTGSLIYLYLPLIPDIAECRDRLGDVSGIKRWLYTKLAAGWTGSEQQKAQLHKAIKAMAVLIIPIAVSVHTVVSWIFGMTLRTGWHSTIFGPYFVVGAIFSGIASIIIAMAIFRRVYHLETFIKPLHFRYLGYLLLTLDIALLYFTISEYLTVVYGAQLQDVAWINSLFTGQYAPLFWSMTLGGFVLPAILIGIPKTRTIAGIVAAAVLANAGMFVERYLIVVPTLALPQSPQPWAEYAPTWVELSITAGSFAGFVLLFTIFSKLFPIVSRWEISEGGQNPSGA